MRNKIVLTLAVATAALGIAGPASASEVVHHDGHHVPTVTDWENTSRHTLSRPATTLSTTSFMYAGGHQILASGTTATGAATNLLVAEPHLDAVNDDHSLAEVAVRDSTTGNTVEIGWTVDPFLNPDSQVHLFSAAWKNGVFLGYNASAAGYVDYSGNAVDVGANIHAAAVDPTFTNRIKKFTISRDTTVPCGSDNTGGWWISYNNAWVGCYQNSIWSGVFTTVNDAEYFGEVATERSTGKPCSDMGNGKPGSSYTTGGLDINDPAFFTSTTWVNTGTAPTSSNTLWNTDANAYDSFNIGSTGNRSFTYGGKGYTSTGTTPGNYTAC